MSVRKRNWRDKQGRQHTRWMIHVEHTWPDGRKQTIRKVSPAQTKRGAEAYEREVRKQLASGTWNGGQKKNTPTLAEFAEEFLAYQATLNKPSEIANKRSMLRTHLIPAFGDTRLDRIDERAIDAYTVARLEHVGLRGKTLSPATINKQLKLLGRMFRVARKWKLVTDVPEITLLKLRKPQFDFLDFGEADALIAAAKQHAPQWHPFVVVALRTGLRFGELAALRWREDVDLERGRLTVQRSYHPDNGFMTTKNDKVRELPLTWDAVAALRNQRARVGSDAELVFQTEAGEILYWNATNNALAEISAAAGLRRVHNHVLRHSFASHAVMRGVPIRQVQEWLGHGSLVVTMRYAHLAKGIGDELIRRLAPPAPADDTTAPEHRAARSQHIDGPRNSAMPNSGRQRPIEP